MFLFDNPIVAWINILKMISSNGIRVGSTKEISNIGFEITNPVDDENKNYYFNSIGEKYFERFKKLILTEEHVPGKGSYLGRLKTGIANFNQIEEIVDVLLKWPQAKCATAIIVQPGVDHKAARFRCGNMPCISQVDFRIREGELIMTAIIRSEDVYHLGYPDYFFLGKLQNRIYHKLNEGKSDTMNNYLKKNRKKNLKKGSLFCYLISAFFQLEKESKIQELISSFKIE